MRNTLFFALIVAVASDNRVVCPEDSNVFGYDSIRLLNEDMETMFGSLDQVANLDVTSHIFRLCPHTVFDGNDRLTPLLNNSHFICGADGSPYHRCTISGGRHQIYLADYPGSNVEYVLFRGITLSDSQEYGVAAQSRSGVADFFDCHWVDGHGISGVQISYEPYVDIIEGEGTDEDALYPGLGLSSMARQGKVHNLFEHRRLSDVESGMTVRIYNSRFEDIFQYGFQAISNSGNLYMHNVSMKDIQAGVLINILGGNATIESSTFESVDAISLIRAVKSAMVEIHDTMFVDSVAVGMVTAIESNVSISNCQFLNNFAPRGGQVLAFESNVNLTDSCIIDSTSMVSVLRTSTSRLLATNVFGQNLVADYCPGVLVEDEDSSCFSGGNCTGECDQFIGTSCSLASSSSLLDRSTSWGSGLISISILIVLLK